MKVSVRLAFAALVSAVGLVSSAHAQSAQPPAPQNLPIAGLAQVTIKVSDLDKARAYYHGVLGLPEAFDLKDKSGNVSSAYFKVNDEQYIELVPGLKPDDLVRQARVVIEATDLKALRAVYAKRALSPSAISKGPDGNPVFRVMGPSGVPIDFLQYDAKSKQGQLMGKLLTPERLSTHLLHAGTLAKDEAARDFFQNKLGFGRVLPGARGDYIETPSTDRNLETKNPPLDPNNPATLAQYTREVAGAVYHFSLEMDDPVKFRDALQARGGYDDVRVRVAAGNIPKWLIHTFDPDGTRTEFLSKENRPADVPPASIIAPGAGNTEVIKAKKQGVFPWPSAPIKAEPVQ